MSTRSPLQVPVIAPAFALDRPLPYHHAVTGSFVLDALIFVYVTAVPGVAVAYATLNKQDSLAWMLVGLVLGIFGLPVLYFTLAMILGTNINPVLLLSTSTLILLAIGIGRFWKIRQRISNEPTGS